MSRMRGFLLEAPGDEKAPGGAAEREPAGGAPAEGDGTGTPPEDPVADNPDEGELGSADPLDAPVEGVDDEEGDAGGGDGDGAEEPEASPEDLSFEQAQQTIQRGKLYDAIVAIQTDLEKLKSSATSVSERSKDKKTRGVAEEIERQMALAAEQADAVLKSFKAFGFERALEIHATLAERAKICAAVLNQMIDGDEDFDSGDSGEG